MVGPIIGYRRRSLAGTTCGHQTRGVTERPPEPASPDPLPPRPLASRLARARASFIQALRALLRPQGLPPEAAAELEAAFGDAGREVFSGGRGRLKRLRTELRAAPPRLLDWMSGQVIDHPAVLYDREGVEQLAARQTRSIATAVGALQLALIGAAAASTLEGGPVLALAIDGGVGQVASVVHGFCDWYNTGSYLVRRLRQAGIAVDRAEVRRLTNAALMSKGRTIEERALDRSTELRLVRSWVGRGLVDALPFGSSLGRASLRATGRIDETDLVGLVHALRMQS
jgi:hypothetical protein